MFRDHPEANDNLTFVIHHTNTTTLALVIIPVIGLHVVIYTLLI